MKNRDHINHVRRERRKRRKMECPEELKEEDRKYSKIRRERYPELLKENCKKFHQKIRMMVIDHYSKGKRECACCQEKEIKFLTVDHINGGGNKERIILGSGTAFYGWIIKNSYPKGYQILCFNCNCAKGAYGKCPHKH